MTEPPKSSGAGRKSERISTGDPEIGARVRAARQRRQWSGEKLGDLLGGVTKSAVSQWESGKTAIEDKHIAALSALLDIPVADLMRLPPGVQPLTEQEKALLAQFRRLSPRRREAFLLILSAGQLPPEQDGGEGQ